MTKAIIWGCTGQDGSHLTELLLRKDYEVVGVVRRVSTNNTQRIDRFAQDNKFQVMGGDITDAFSIRKVLESHPDVDEVYNLAAQSHVSVSFEQPATTWDITGKGCLNILQTIIDLKLLNVRFYQASSSEMFGKNFDPASDGYGQQDENTKFMPQSPYAIAKCAAHYMTRLYREAYGLHASAGILFNHEGPRRGDTFVTRKITKWIGEFCAWKKTQEGIFPANTTGELSDSNNPNLTFPFDSSEGYPKLRLGNLDAYRDWGYAGDYVEAMWLMLQQSNPDDYVICTGETHTIREFLDIAFRCAGIQDWTEYVVTDPKFYRPAEVDYLRGCNHKAQQVLGWRPKHSFEELVILMVDHDLNDNL